MNKYSHYQVDDFIWDAAFRQWVLSPTRESDAYWQQWLAANTEKTAIIKQARHAVQALALEELDLSDSEIRYTVQRTLSRIKPNSTQDSQSADLNFPRIPMYRQTWFRLAALFILMLGTGLSVWLVRYTGSFTSTPPLVSYQDLISTKTLTEVVNKSAKPMPVKLTDGSLIILKTGSRISYNPMFDGPKREVYLSGEGFFEVAKDAEKPFLIYANGLVTKVLGTSFIIKAYPTDEAVTVEVKTGRVAVFAQSDPLFKEKKASRELEGVLLTPNQRIVYVRDKVRFAKSLIDEPQLTAELVAKSRFTFDETPVSQALATLEKAYEVDIVYDEQLLAHCPLTAMLDDQSLFEKLDVICQVIEARYEVIDGQIVIHSRGCRP